METDVAITMDDGQGRHRRIAVASARFTIGRSSDNDLAIDDNGLSRRHAVIERYDHLVQITDCGSQNGTFVNDAQVVGSIALHDNDVVSIGSACTLVVHIKPTGSQKKATTEDSADKTIEHREAAPAQSKNLLSAPVIAVVCVTALLAIALLIGFLNRESGAGNLRAENRASRIDVNENENRQSLPAEDRIESDGKASEAITIEQIEKAAAQAVRRVSSDDKPYVFPPNAQSALEDMKRKVEAYKSSPAFRRALESLTKSGASIAAEARRAGVEPYLVIYTALAEAEERASVNAAEAAREALPRLLSLRKMFGTEMADKSLITVAAYRMGGGTKKSHPLLETMRRVVKNPLTDRNVWYVYERGGIDKEVYGFVVSFLASGIVAQNPRQFGVEAAPLVF